MYRWQMTECELPREAHESVDYLTLEQDRRRRQATTNRAAIVVYFDLNPVPGDMHTPDMIITAEQFLEKYNINTVEGTN